MARNKVYLSRAHHNDLLSPVRPQFHIMNPSRDKIY
jgi:hypothetical protein